MQEPVQINPELPNFDLRNVRPKTPIELTPILPELPVNPNMQFRIPPSDTEQVRRPADMIEQERIREARDRAANAGVRPAPTHDPDREEGVTVGIVKIRVVRRIPSPQ